MGKVLETAKEWVNMGISVIPVGYRSKQPKVKWLAYTEQLPTQAELDNWFASDLTNIGIITGWRNLCIIDFDDMDVFMDWYSWATAKGGKAKDVALYSRMHRSARGVHIYILSENTENMKLPKIDILAHRKYALLPPSIHPSGTAYTVYRDVLPMPVHSLYDILPKKLLDTAYAAKTASSSHILSKQDDIDISGTVDFDPWKLAGKDTPSESLVAQIKKQIHITDILSGHSFEKSTNGWLMTRCPLHDDRNPSMWINEKNTLCGCNAGCTPLPLDVINLYARMKGIDNIRAIHELAERLH